MYCSMLVDSKLMPACARRFFGGRGRWSSRAWQRAERARRTMLRTAMSRGIAHLPTPCWADIKPPGGSYFRNSGCKSRAGAVGDKLDSREAVSRSGWQRAEYKCCPADNVLGDGAEVFLRGVKYNCLRPRWLCDKNKGGTRRKDKVF